MFDLSAELQTFYDTNVRLGVDRRKRLAGHRDLNLSRLNGGLDDLAEETGRTYPHPYGWQNQGGYAMHTLNQDPRDDNDYDIDVAVLFERDALPENPLSARQRVAEALAKRCTNFTQEPTARTNAVTIWYAEGHHVDFAVYRRYDDEFGIEHLEHASTEWKRRDPQEINNWFQKRVTTLSPNIPGYTTVKEGQFRRIVRFLKWFSRSRTSWSLPGGLIMSTLAAECYRPDHMRDDVALYNTMSALNTRLSYNTSVHNPVDNTEFTANSEILNQVERLKSNLDLAVGKLAVLFDANCNRQRARSAWDWVFNHAYWGGEELAKAALDESIRGTAVSAYYVNIRCGLARKEGGKIYKWYESGSSTLPKNIHLRFNIESTNVPYPYDVVWEVINQGDEAKENDQLSWSSEPSSSTEKWTETAYKGVHKMLCKVRKNGIVVAETEFVVKVAPGRWLRAPKRH